MRVRACVGRYMFAQDPLKGLREDYGAPNFFADRSRYGYSREERAETALFYVGPAGSGVNFHQHTNAWNALFYGRKRWFLFPPALTAYSFLPMRDWLAEHKNASLTTASRPLRCTQHAGDVLFVPEMWGHATHNILPTVGTAIEFVGLKDQLQNKVQAYA